MKDLFQKITLVLVVVLMFNIASCSDDDDTKPSKTEVSPGNDPNFSIVPNKDGILPKYNRKVVVFGIDIYAVAAVEDTKLLHAANVMAQYLDNDEDGTVDDQLLLDKMLENKAFLVMWKNESDLTNTFLKGRLGQDLGNDETNPTYVSGGKTSRFDATLEEVLHIINNAGHSYAYPEAFGQNVGSKLANAMDIARWGQFMKIPSSYPKEAWYTYTDATCDYASCQTIEYMYWALTSILGAQETRFEEIKNEWKLNTKAKVEATDKVVYTLLTNPKYKLPKVLPDGTYKR